MSLKRVLLLLMLVLIGNACCTKKKKVLEENKEIEINKDSINDKLIKEGYKKAYVIYNEQKEAPCNYLIKVDDNLLIEPMHELENSFKIGELPIWVKYHPQRRMSRCINSQPVEIIAIKKR